MRLSTLFKSTVLSCDGLIFTLDLYFSQNLNEKPDLLKSVYLIMHVVQCSSTLYLMVQLLLFKSVHSGRWIIFTYTVSHTFRCTHTDACLHMHTHLFGPSTVPEGQGLWCKVKQTLVLSSACSLFWRPVEQHIYIVWIRMTTTQCLELLDPRLSVCNQSRKSNDRKRDLGHHMVQLWKWVQTDD